MLERRVKRQQALSMLTAAQLHIICDTHYIKSKWDGAYHLRIAIQEAWSKDEDSSIDVDVSEMIRSMIK